MSEEYNDGYEQGFQLGYEVCKRDLEFRTEELQEALRFYADDENWQGPVFGGIELVSVVEQDDGETARAALSSSASEAKEDTGE